MALRDSACTVMLPKASAAGVAAVVEALGEQTRVLALVETATGVVQASSICALPQVIRLAFGSIDFSTELGVAADDREALLHARSTPGPGVACGRHRTTPGWRDDRRDGGEPAPV